MRRRSLLLAVPAGLLTLAGCGDDSGKKTSSSHDGTPGSPPAPTGKVVDGPLPKVTGGTAFGAKPTIAKESGKPASDLAVKTLVKGHGDTIAKGDYVQLDYVGQAWDTAKVFDSTYVRGEPGVIQAGANTVPGWDQALIGKKTGTRVELAVPPHLGYGKKGNPQLGIKPTDTIVFVLDPSKVFNGSSSADGKKVPQDAGLPKVGTNTDGKAPSIEVPKTKAPSKVAAGYVLEGDGPKLKESDQVLVQYRGVVWETGKEFDSSYKKKPGSPKPMPVSFGLQQVVPGWRRGMVGKKVGSRIVIVVPPKEGYGDNPPKGSGLTKDSTMVFSVDILARM